MSRPGHRVGNVAVTMRPPLHAFDQTSTSLAQRRTPMSRAHDRAYRLLAEKMRLSHWARRLLYVIIAASVVSGVWWLAVHYGGEGLFSVPDDLHRLALETMALKIHGATGFLMLIAVGAMSANHVRRGWGMARNRLSGSLVVTSIAVLVLTAYALYYLVDDATRPPVSLIHWVIGLILVPVVIVHIVSGRRGRLPRINAATPIRRAGH